MRSALSIVASILITLVAAGVASAPYHTSPTPPAYPPPSPPPGQPSPSGLSAVRAQAKVAGTHAGFAAGAGTVSAAKEHLGHALVCIEGPSGRNVNRAWENVCRGMGSGVLVDLQRIKANPALLQKARSADATAAAAIRGTTLARIKAGAKQVSVLMLQIAQTK